MLDRQLMEINLVGDILNLMVYDLERKKINENSKKNKRFPNSE